MMRTAQGVFYENRTTLASLRALGLAALSAPLSYAASGEVGAASQADCDKLVSTLEQRRMDAVTPPPVTLDQARTYQRNKDQQACHDALQRLEVAGAPAGEQKSSAQPNSAQDSGRVVVQEPAPAVRVEQAAPQVTVQQPQPQVSVKQPRPEITVRMPPPTITVQQPPPEITVRMPNPEVSVKTPQPQVAVNQPQPKVQVEQPKEAPQVQVQHAAPQVETKGGEQANVQVEHAEQPQVHFEQAGKPNVQFSMSGEPKITFEKAPEAKQPAEAARTADLNEPGAANNAAAQPLATAAQPNAQRMQVAKLKGLHLYNVGA